MISTGQGYLLFDIFDIRSVVIISSSDIANTNTILHTVTTRTKFNNNGMLYKQANQREATDVLGMAV